MQTTRTLIISVLCMVALCCVEVSFAANSVTDLSGRVWCVRTEVSSAPVMGQEIYLFDEEGILGEFITMDKALDTTPHVFLTTSGKIGIVWSRENEASGRMEICSTIYDQASGLWVQPFSILSSPSSGIDHTEPRMETSQNGTTHLIYVSKSVEGDIMVSSLIYRIMEGENWSEPATVSLPNEDVAGPEFYLGASDKGFPLVLVYLSVPRVIGVTIAKQSAQAQRIKSLQKDDVDPTPWTVLSKHRLPINLR